RSVGEALNSLARTATTPQGRAHALWTLDGLNLLQSLQIERAMKDPEAGVREQALRLADRRLAGDANLRTAAAALANDPSPRVRFQAAFTLGEADAPEVVSALAAIVRRDLGDPWTQTAVLSSAVRSAPALLESLVRDPEFIGKAGPARHTLLTK